MARGKHRSPDQPVGTRRLAKFSNAGYSNGRHLPSMILWFIAQNLFFGAWYFPAGLRPVLLRMFGAEIGDGCLIRHGVRVHWPWRLHLGDDVWIGESVWLHTIEDIWIEDNVCVSQRASITTGSHHHSDPEFHTDNAPVRIRSGAWIGAEALVMRGVTVGVNSLVGARAVAFKDVPDNTMLIISDQKLRPNKVQPDAAAASAPGVTDISDARIAN